MYFCKKSWLLVVFITPIVFACTNPKGFDEICLIYTEAKEKYSTPDEISKYIFDNVEARVNSAPALQVHSAIYNIASEERYPIFKQSAEEALQREWSCQVMKEMWGTK
jgi:hypothetical protein